MGTAAEIMRVEKKSFINAIFTHVLMALDSDGSIRKCVLERGETKKVWTKIGTVGITSEEWLTVCRDIGFELTDAVHQVC